MDKLAELNEKFCADAHELRYILKLDGKLVFSNSVRPHSPHVGSWLRSVKFADENSYLFLLDVDSDYLSRKIIEGVKGLYETIYNYLHIKPLLKASGSKGAQLVFKLNFEDDLTENECVDHMRDLAYTIWRLSTPSVREKIGFDEKPGIDCAVYKRRQMLRSFCIHLGSEKYSVPFKYHDSTGMIRRRMKLAAPLLDFEGFEELDFNKDDILYKYEKRNAFSIHREVTHLKASDPKLRVKRTDRDQVYKRMPEMIKTIVDNEHVAHDLKWPVITYLHYFECMTESEISEWLFAHTYWKDLSNVDITNYHVGWSCNWARKSFKSKRKEKPKSLEGVVPLPKEVMDDVRESLFKHYFRISEKVGWFQYLAYLRKTRDKFSDFLESEPYAR